ncbi:MAG: alpha/beta hydrolase [Acidobacteriota bacterium]
MSKEKIFLTKSSTNVRPLSWQISLTRWGLGITEQILPELAAHWAAGLFLTPHRHTRPTREQELLAQAEGFDINWHGSRLAAWQWGRGPTVLLVHGWEGRGAQLGSFIPQLVTAGFRVVAFDGPGHGDSAGNRSSMVELADAIKTVANVVGEIEGVVAHSMGTAATTLAINAGLSVKRLVYLAPPIAVSDYLNRFARLLNISPALHLRIQRRLEARFNMEMSALNSLTMAPNMTTPLLVFHDRQDFEVCWQDGAALAGAWPYAKFVITTGLGHRRILHNREVIAAAVAFLAGGEANEIAPHIAKIRTADETADQTSEISSNRHSSQSPNSTIRYQQLLHELGWQ